VTTAVQPDAEVRRRTAAASSARIVTDGKFLRIPPSANAPGGDRFLVKGVTYGTFAPDADGYQF